MLGCACVNLSRLAFTRASSAGDEEKPETVRVIVPLSGAAVVVFVFAGQSIKLVVPLSPCCAPPEVPLLPPLEPLPPHAASRIVKIVSIRMNCRFMLTPARKPLCLSQ